MRAVKWLCDEQECEGAPRFAYDYLPAVSADGEHVAIVEERDGWGHTRSPGVRVVSTATGASERFFPVIAAHADLQKDLSKKSEYEALVRAANEGLATYDFRPLFPAREDGTSDSEPRAKTTFRVAGIAIDVVVDPSPSRKLDAIVIRQDGATKRISARDWDPGSGCSQRGFRLLGARPDVHVAVFVSEITLTGHNCDGVAEKQPWAVRAVRW